SGRSVATTAGFGRRRNSSTSAGSGGLGTSPLCAKVRAMSAAERRARFRSLHERGLFVMPNPWDVGSAKLLAAEGFQALATTSAGFALSIGKLDQQMTRDELVAHVEALAAATQLPLNVDSERC